MHTLITGAAVAALASLTAACDGDDTLALPARLTGFHTPESVLHDPERDVYWVSNMGGGGAHGHDGDGFLSRIEPDGTVDLRFAAPERSGAVLDSPKGMAIAGGELYVADVDRVRVLDPDTGAPIRDVPIADVAMLNDVAAAPDGTVYVTDIGLDVDFLPTGSDAVYRIADGGAPERWAAGELGNPNGVAVTERAIWLVTFGSGELLELGSDGAVRARHAAPRGGLDGIEPLDDGRLLITSFGEGAVLTATPGGAFAVERDGLETSADLGVDRERGRLLVPLMTAGEVLVDALASDED
jgi:sugar lactone lactonase YvrE